MYIKGDIRYDDHFSYDARVDEQSKGGPMFYLPHSCDEWVIGTKEEAQALIEDIQNALVDL